MVRHPMYLGVLVFCLGFFILYDEMATYEEEDLVRILGGEYAAYQERVPKCFPRPRPESQLKLFIC